MPDSPEFLSSAVRRLIRGEAVAYPTETCYGLGVRADDPGAVAFLRRLKGRGDSAISLLIPGPERLEEWVAPLKEAERRLIARFWPGPLTLLFQALPDSPVAHMAQPLLGFRCSSHPVAQELAKAAGLPITSTSANESGILRAPGEAQARAFLAPHGVSVLPDPDGLCREIESTVATLADGNLRILREGAISAEEIKKTLEESR